MSRVYSSQLAGVAGLGGGGDTPIASPPAGHVWVIRSMSAAFAAVPGIALSGFVLSLNGNLWVWSLTFPVVPEFAYQWDGRQVLGETDELDFSSSDAASWSLLVSGYDLLLP